MCRDRARARWVPVEFVWIGPDGGSVQLIDLPSSTWSPFVPLYYQNFHLHHHPPPPTSLPPHISIMADVYVAKKIAAVLPPPAFSDIAKSSNDVRLRHRGQLLNGAIANARLAAHQQGLLPRRCRSGASLPGALHMLTMAQPSLRSSSRLPMASTSPPRAPRRTMALSLLRYVVRTQDTCKMHARHQRGQS